MMKTGHHRNMRNGSVLVLVLVFAAIATMLLGALVSWAVSNIKLARQTVRRELAVEIAEAGNDYYRWHLAHAATDYTDGTTTPGPYVHVFADKDGNTVGQFSLGIVAPLVGSTLVTINSTGTIAADPTISRTIQTQLAIPSLAKYATAANDNMRFGAGTEVYGPLVSNKGIRFDGVAHNLVQSALSTYTDPDNGLLEFGVYTQDAPADPQPPAAVPNRPDVFMAGRQFPVAPIDFVGMTSDLSLLKTNAQASGRYFSNSGFLGYHMVLKTNDTFDLYKVKTLTSTSGSCTNSLSQTGWGSWSIAAGGETFVANYAFPANGLIFLDDHLWIDGQINGARLTIGAGTFPDNVSTRRSITVNNNLLYTNFDGRDVIGLIAQNNLNVGMISANDLTIHAALVAGNGRVGRYYYPSACTNSTRNSLTLLGMIATNIRYGFSYTDNTGYTTRTINYDGNFLYSPPPSFPLTGSTYQTISWRESK
jgi:hypothetical protein